jgi:hypothetical protein
MNVIERPGGVNDLKRQIMAEYIKFLKGEIAMNKKILSDEKWASGGSEYHKDCRARMEKDVLNMEKQLGMLTKKSVKVNHR